MDSFDFENADGEPEESGRSKKNFDDEINELKERLKNSGGGSTNIEVLEEIVAFYFEHDKFEEALHFVDLLLEYIPFSADTWQRKGVILNNLQRYQEALECFEKGLSMNPVDTELILSRGVALDNLGKHEEALRCYEEVLEGDPCNEEALFSKAITLEKL